MSVVGIGRVIFWKGGSLWIGRAMAPADFHSHHAVQLAIGFDGPVQFRGDENESWTVASAILVPPGFAHAFQAPGVRVANLLFEPTTKVARGLLELYGGDGLMPIPDDVIDPVSRPLRDLFNTGADGALAAEAEALLPRLAGSSEPKRRTDPRILASMDWIGQNLSRPFSLPDAAAVACLSEDRFRHLFVQETGIAFRPYVLWSRLNLALKMGFAEQSWTDAAHAAGFADQAHLTRTCRRMLGLVPVRCASLRFRPCFSRRNSRFVQSRASPFPYSRAQFTFSARGNNMAMRLSKRHFLFIPVAAAIAVGLAHAGGMMAAVPDNLDYALTHRTDAGLYTASLDTGKQPVAVGTMLSFILTLKDIKGRPVEHAVIAIDGGMPQHGHGLPTRPRVTAALGDGRYRIDGVKFNMSGWWTFTVHADAPSGSDTSTFNLKL